MRFEKVREEMTDYAVVRIEAVRDADMLWHFVDLEEVHPVVQMPVNPAPERVALYGAEIGLYPYSDYEAIALLVIGENYIIVNSATLEPRFGFLSEDVDLRNICILPDGRVLAACCVSTQGSLDRRRREEG